MNSPHHRQEYTGYAPPLPGPPASRAREEYRQCWYEVLRLAPPDQPLGIAGICSREPEPTEASRWRRLLNRILFVQASGDPATLLVPDEATAQDIQNMRERLGLEEPLVVQYFTFIRDTFTGNIESFRYQQDLIPLF